MSRTVYGFVSEIRYTDRKNGEDYLLKFRHKKSWSTSSGKSSFLMVVSPNKKEIAIVPWSNVAEIPVAKVDQRKHGTAYKIKVPNSKPVLIGHITWIEYWSNKLDSKGEWELLGHPFKKKQRLYANRALTLFAIKASKPLLGDRGIIG